MSDEIDAAGWLVLEGSERQPERILVQALVEQVQDHAFGLPRRVERRLHERSKSSPRCPLLHLKLAARHALAKCLKVLQPYQSQPWSVAPLQLHEIAARRLFLGGDSCSSACLLGRRSPTRVPFPGYPVL